MPRPFTRKQLMQYANGSIDMLTIEDFDDETVIAALEEYRQLNLEDTSQWLSSRLLTSQLVDDVRDVLLRLKNSEINREEAKAEINKLREFYLNPENDVGEEEIQQARARKERISTLEAWLTSDSNTPN
jgi:hypothetical protein